MSSIEQRNDGAPGRRRVGSAGRGILAVAAASLAAVTWAVAAAATAGPAAAGGVDPISTARDRYEPGQTVVMIGYGEAGPVGPDQKSYYAWLRVDPAAPNAAAAEDAFARVVRPTDRRVAPVVVQQLAAPDRWRTHRVSITFDLPANLPPTRYLVEICDDPCASPGPGAFWPELLHVGVDPEHPVVRDWPLDEPMIRWLEDDALLLTPWGEQVTAADVRAGRVEPPPSAAPAGASDPSTSDRAATAPSPASEKEGRARVGLTSDALVGEAAPQQADGRGADPRRDGWWAGGLLLLVGVAVVACTLIGSRHMLSRSGRRSVGDAGSRGQGPSPAAAQDDAHDSRGTGDSQAGRPVASGTAPDLQAVLVPDREIEPESARPAHRQSARVRTRARTRDRTGDRTRARL